jgi:glutamate-5-semialdehyde dehydrogenase
MVDVVALAARAKEASRTLARATRADKDRVLADVAARLDAEAASASSRVLAANARDLEAGRELSPALADRLRLDPARLSALASAVRAIATLPDPVGEVLGMSRRPNGLVVGRVRVPLGLVAMIYESRPNVTIDAAALCLKSGNACLLRGGREARETNRALGDLFGDALAAAGLPREGATLLIDLDREGTKALLGLSGVVDLAIPRGGERLIRFVTEHARVPVIQHYKGVCHLYVDEGADARHGAPASSRTGRPSAPGVQRHRVPAGPPERGRGAAAPRRRAL